MQLHHLKGYIQNIYLVEYSHGCMLLDGACRADYKVVERYFSSTLKRPLSDLKMVIVTHMHPDHAGCAHYFRKKTGCKVVCGEFNSHWYQGISGRFAHLTDILLTHWVAGRIGRKKRLIWYPRILRADMYLKEGDAIPGFPDWHVTMTPGHTNMDISVYCNTEKLIYVADLIVQNKGQLTPPYPVHFPDVYQDSVKKLYHFHDFTVLMAHVKPQKVGKESLEAIISKTPKQSQSSSKAILNVAKKRLGLRFDTHQP